MDDCGEQILVRGGIGPWGGLEHGRGYVREAFSGIVSGGVLGVAVRGY
jgi:hypothetical protein